MNKIEVVTPWWKAAINALDVVLCVLTVLFIWRLVVAIKAGKQKGEKV